MSRSDIIAYIHGNARGLLDALARVRRDARDTARSTQGEFAMMSQRLRGEASTLARTFAGAFAGGLFAGGAAGFLQGARSVVSELSEMGKQIDRIGMSAKTFQELRFGFELAGVASASFSRGMESFAQRIGEAATKGNELTRIFAANNVALRDSAGNIRSNEALLRDYANLIRNAGSDQEQMTLATRAFGEDAGRSFVNALKDGTDGLDAMAKAAAEAGGTIDEELIRKAEELDDRWASTWRSFEMNAKSAIMNVVTAMDDIAAKFREFDRVQAAAAAGARIGAMAGNPPPDPNRPRRRVVRGPDARINAAFGGTEPEGDRAIERMLRQRYGGTTVVPAGNEQKGGGRAGGRNAAAAAALREAEAVQKLIENLAHELSLVSMSDLEKSKANALRQAGAAASDEERQQIEALVTAIHSETEALRENEEAQKARGQAIENLFQMGNDALSALMSKSEDAGDVVRRLAVQLALAGAQAALLGTGPLAGLFGSGGRILGGLPFFGGARARGGEVSPGRVYQINEKEYFAPGSAGRIIPPGGGAFNMTFAPQIDARGADREGLARVERQLQRMQAEMPAKVIDTVRKAQAGRMI